MNVLHHSIMYTHEKVWNVTVYFGAWHDKQCTAFGSIIELSVNSEARRWVSVCQVYLATNGYRPGPITHPFAYSHDKAETNPRLTVLREHLWLSASLKPDVRRRKAPPLLTSWWWWQASERAAAPLADDGDGAQTDSGVSVLTKSKLRACAVLIRDL